MKWTTLFTVGFEDCSQPSSPRNHFAWPWVVTSISCCARRLPQYVVEVATRQRDHYQRLRNEAMARELAGARVPSGMSTPTMSLPSSMPSDSTRGGGEDGTGALRFAR